MDPNNLNVEERLRQAVPSAEPDWEFKNRLRRALLNSQYWTEPRWVRWVAIFRRWAPLSASAIAAGFLIAVTLHAVPAPVKSTTPTTLTVQNTATIQELEEQGRLRYVGQNFDGVRVYQVNLDDGTSLELHDPAPYAIELTHQ